ncbi:MAG: amidohydrolase family protein [Clostridia bacterium]|nr:amidohydrolase family protein [Clostridia bacterium]
MTKIKKIDIHAHAVLFQEYAPIWRNEVPWVSPKQVLGFYDDLNIEKGVLLPIVSPEYHQDQLSNADCKYITEQYPDRFLWFCGIDPRALGNAPDADLSLLLNHYKSLGAKGMGELTAQLYADDPMLDNLFTHCEACDMPVTIHIGPQFGGCYGIVDDMGLPRLEKVLQRHPKLKILGHSQPFWAEIGTNVDPNDRNTNPGGKIEEGRLIELLRKYDNLYCDCSAGSGSNALMRDPDYTDQFFAEFSDRLLYGCDICQSFNRFPYKLDAFLDQMLRDKRISEENYYKFVRGNAIKLLKLEDAE